MSVVSKLIEKIIHQRLEQLLQPGGKQSGFRKGDGAHLQLTRLVQQWFLAIDSGYMVGVVFFDFKKAFDRVWIPGLPLKLEALGVRGDALAWFESFLSNRRQCTMVGSALSTVSILHAGVHKVEFSPHCFSLSISE